MVRSYRQQAETSGGIVRHAGPIVVLAMMAAGTAWGGAKAIPWPRDEHGHVLFQETVKVEGATAADLYSRAKAWAVWAYRGATDAIVLDHPDGHRLIVMGLHRESFAVTTWVYFGYRVSIETEDGRYRRTVDQLTFQGERDDRGLPLETQLTKDGVGVVGRKAVIERFRKVMLALSADIDTALKTPAAGATKSDR